MRWKSVLPLHTATGTTGKEDTRCQPVAIQSNGPNDKHGACIVRIHNQRDRQARGCEPQARQCVSEKLTAAPTLIFFALPSFDGTKIMMNAFLT
ncbi:MAG: hypothetical protein IKW77_06795 [Salinivirgaceae bacterium]|nr:hypothetical protein [Salinivirgaceae bacterium]